VTNSTDDYWDIDGTSLQTNDWGIDDFGGSLEAPPQLRGKGQTVPYRAGTLWRRQVPDSRVLTFNMWCSADDDNIPGGTEQLLANWQQLRALFWGGQGRQLAITRRWNDGTKSATALGTFAGGLEPVNFGLQLLRFSADVFLADPWFYGPSVTLLDAVGAGTHAVNIAGDGASQRFALTVAGAFANVGIQVKRGDEVLSTLTSTAASQTAASFTVAWPDLIRTGTATGNLSQFTPAQPTWIDLDPSATAIVVSGTGAGTVTLTYEPAYV
jgi:hypothetical protein